MEEREYPRIMVVHTNSDGKHHQHMCANRSCHIEEGETIPTYYSYQHAYDFGWRRMEDVDGETRWYCKSCVL